LKFDLLAGLTENNPNVRSMLVFIQKILLSRDKILVLNFVPVTIFFQWIYESTNMPFGLENILGILFNYCNAWDSN